MMISPAGMFCEFFRETPGNGIPGKEEIDVETRFVEYRSPEKIDN